MIKGYIHNIKKIEYFMIFLILFFIPYIASTQEETLKFERVTSEDGLLKNAVNTIFQDSEGFMWFGCESSLIRFDGYNVKIIEKSLHNNTIISGRVTTINEGKQGFLWIGTNIGLLRYDRKNEDLIKYPVNSNENTSHEIKKLIADLTYLYIATDKGIYKLNFSTQEITPLTFTNDSLLQSANYIDLCKDNDSIIWLSSSNGLIKYNLKTFNYSVYKHQKGNTNSLLENNCTVCRKINDNLWIGHDNGITIFNPGNNTYERITPDNNDTTQLIPTKITSIFQDDQGRIYIGTISRGLYQFNPDKNIFYRYTNIPDNNNSLSNDWVRYIYQDKFKVLWIATFGGGLNKIFTDRKKFHTLAYSAINPNSLVNNQVFGITEDKNNNIWFATLGGLSKYNTKDQLFTNFTSIGKENNIDWSVYCDRSGNIWIGSSTGLLKYDPDNNIIYKYQHPKTQKIINRTVYAIFEDSKGFIWVGTQNDGLIKFKPDNDEFIEYHNIPGNSNSLSHNTVWRIVEGFDGFIWFATAKGLNKFNPNTDKFVNYFHETDNSKSLSSDNICEIFFSSDKIMWIGTSGGGLLKYNNEQDDFTRYGEELGFPSNVIYSILEDGSGNLWLASDNGLTKFNPISLNIKNYTAEQGLQSNEFNFPKLKSKSGLFYFGGTNGVTYFFPDSIAQHTITPKVIISGIKIINKKVQPGDTINDRVLLKHPIENTKEIKLIYKDKSITLEFAALHYAFPDKNLYKYKLEGFDDEWNSIGNKRFATYTNLPAGNYTFMVKACNFDGVWNETPTSLKITVEPPYWRKWWFRISTILFIILVAFVLIRNKIRNIKVQNKILEEKVQTRTETLYEVNSELEERQTDLEVKQEEILAQRDAIELQNKELEKLSIVARETDNAIVIADRNGNIEWINEGFTRLYGYTLIDLYKSGLNNFTEFSKTTNIIEIINYCLKSKKSKIYESLNHSKSGHNIWTQTTITPIIDDDKNVIKLIAIDSDINKLKLAELEIREQKDEIQTQRDYTHQQNHLIEQQNKELEKHRNRLEQLVKERTAELESAKLRAEESDRLKSAFLANMSHEIRTPMNAIIGFTDLLNDPDLTNETKQELTQLINYNSDSLLRLIDDIIDISRIESNQLVIEIQECKLENIYNQLVLLFNEKKQEFRKNQIEILTDIPDNEKKLIINTDPFRLRQILINLMDNALKFTEKGKIEIGYRKTQNKKNREITFFVKDTGIGLSDEQKKIIFNRFSKVEDNKTKLYRGAGLGLAICKNLIELLGGKIWVESEKDTGSIFYFTVPFTKLAKNE